MGFDHKLLIPKEDQIEVTNMNLLARGRDALRRATAVVAYNEPVALGVYAAAAALNLSIPHDLSVASFDDLYANVAYPTMTVVNQKLFEVGGKVAEVLLEMIQQPSAWTNLRSARFKVSPELVVRRSTAAPRDTSSRAAQKAPRSSR